MRALSIELEDETVDALEAERELFGFESRGAYVRWIVANRGSIEAEREPDREATQDRVLADHGERIARLEERVSSLVAALEDDGTEASTTNGEPVAEHPSPEPNDASSDERTAREPTDETAPDDRDSRLEVRGAPRTVRQGPDSRIRPDEPATGARQSADGVTKAAEATKPEQAETSDDGGTKPPSTGSITPERVARIREDPVHEDAGVLGTVESERLDELSRRAVATTRKRLDRDVQTGLEYTSSTRLAGAGVRPGEDIADLDALSVPGRSAETLENRRRAVGRALAFLRDEGRARRSDFVDALYAECPAGYETADGWWGCLKEGLKQVDAVDGGEGTRVWRYHG
ncbi:hypothetical protein [Natronolimnohabitans innermongolicus]|uniref:Uncharacterized protein n=1 Tax=Natronolimnohabitans innermongolicus JCM 12255 TaxID=1227499 RepID=L9XLP8_9EURY|nr:hypothetical protein [Natronolimnohabitans innermongolicus]ELY61573.1 hypothetical protein C493_01876 [Natronolimnohabitans innermongolicus JCM 12255]